MPKDDLSIVEGKILAYDDEPTPAGEYGNWKVGVQLETADGRRWWKYWGREPAVRAVWQALRKGAVLRGIGSAAAKDGKTRRTITKVETVDGKPVPEAPAGPGGPQAPPPPPPPPQPRPDIAALGVEMPKAYEAAKIALSGHAEEMGKERFWEEVGRAAITLFIEARRRG